jgi:hypothetical protein
LKETPRRAVLKSNILKVFGDHGNDIAAKCAVQAKAKRNLCLVAVALKGSASGIVRRHEFRGLN